MNTQTLKLKLIVSAAAEDWCAVAVWAAVAQAIHLGTNQADVVALVERGTWRNQGDTICWQCVDAWNDAKRALEEEK